MKIVLTIVLVLTLPVFLLNFMYNGGLLEQVNGQNPDEKLYVLLFEENKVANIDNSTSLVAAIVGHNLVKIEEELLEELSLAPTQQLEEQVNKIISNGTNGFACNVSLTTQDGEKVGINCISSGDVVIWHLFPM